MRRILLAALVGALLGAGGLSLANNAPGAKGGVAKLSERDIEEKLNGKDSRVTTVEVTLEPGEAGHPHRHTGPVFGYVLEGEYELGLGDQPAKTLKVGDTFYEPTGIVHRVSRNPGTKGRTRVLAILVTPRDAKQITIPVTEK
jgi:quercetin dioxygenase-like cupin family protein